MKKALAVLLIGVTVWNAQAKRIAFKKHEVDKADAEATQNATAGLDSYASAEPDGPDPADQVMAGVDLVKSAASFAKDPNVQSAGGALVAAAGVAALIPAPPASLIVAGVLGVAGSLMQVFGEGDPPDLTNRELLSKIEEGFRKLGVQLTHIESQVAAIYDYVVLGLQKIKGLLAEHRKYLTQMESALHDPVVLDDAVRTAQHAQDVYGSMAYDTFTKQNVGALLESASKKGCQALFDAYQEIIAARTGLFQMVLHAQVARHKKFDAYAKEYSELLRDQVKEYQQLIDSYHVPVSMEDKNDCDRSLKRWVGIQTTGSVAEIAVDESYVYGVNSNGLLYKVRNSGGGWAQLTSTGYVNNIATTVGDAYVYGCNGKYVYRVSKNGGSWSGIQTTGQVQEIAVDNYYVYGVNSNGWVYRVSKNGGGWALIQGTGSVNRIAVDDYYIYGCNGALTYRVPKGGGSWSAVTRTGSVEDIAVDGYYLYGRNSNGWVYRVPKTGGNWEAVDTSGAVFYIGTTNDDNYIYGSNYQTNVFGGGSGGYAYRIPKNSGKWWATPRKQR